MIVRLVSVQVAILSLDVVGGIEVFEYQDMDQTWVVDPVSQETDYRISRSVLTGLNLTLCEVDNLSSVVDSIVGETINDSVGLVVDHVESGSWVVAHNDSFLSGNV